MIYLIGEKNRSENTLGLLKRLQEKRSGTEEKKSRERGEAMFPSLKQVGIDSVELLNYHQYYHHHHCEHPPHSHHQWVDFFVRRCQLQKHQGQLLWSLFSRLYEHLIEKQKNKERKKQQQKKKSKQKKKNVDLIELVQNATMSF